MKISNTTGTWTFWWQNPQFSRKWWIWFQRLMVLQWCVFFYIFFFYYNIIFFCLSYYRFGAEKCVWILNLKRVVSGIVTCVLFALLGQKNRKVNQKLTKRGGQIWILFKIDFFMVIQKTKKNNPWHLKITPKYMNI